MKKKDFVKLTEQLEEGTLEQAEVVLWKEEVTDQLIYPGIVKAICLFIALVFAFFMQTNITKLSFISPSYYFILTIFAIIVMVCFIGYFLRIRNVKQDSKEEEINDLKFRFKLYSIFDFISFFFVSLSTVYLITMFLMTPAMVEQDSMNDTYYSGDRILVWHLGYQVKRGDVIVIEVKAEEYNPLQSARLKETDFLIKRAVAVAGDKIEFRKERDNWGMVYVNDLPLQEMRLDEFEIMMTAYDHDTPVAHYTGVSGIVPKGYAIALGDNRNNSLDSNDLGLVPTEHILGKSFFRIYPFHRIGNPKQNIKED